MRSTFGAVLASALFVTGAANAPPARADAWSASAALERQAIKVHPWDPESFRHPEQYAEDGLKLTGGKSAGKQHPVEPPSLKRP